MSANTHPKGKSPFKSDLERNPGIGQSKGTFATGVVPEEIEGENTVEGDVDNDARASDGIAKREHSRSNV